jgi:putative glutamine amidotransferase
VPLIAISPCSAMHDYEESIRRAGGDVKVLDAARDAPADVIASCDGLLLTGGDDVLPAIYGEPAHASFQASEAGRDDYELELVRRCTEADLPLLGICRGIQVMNVARGGSLIQDIASEPGFGPHTAKEGVQHDVREPRVAIAHEAWVTDGTRLAEIMGGDEPVPVNSRHHQAVRAAGNGLVVSATAPDGIIEAIEDPSRRYFVGVQWHPENFYRTGEFRPLFESFVEAASRTRT